MGKDEIEKEYVEFKGDIEKMAEEELKKVKKKVEILEAEAEKTGEAAEISLNGDKKS